MYKSFEKIPVYIGSKRVIIEVEILDKISGNSVAIYELDNAFYQCEFNLYQDICADDKVHYQSWCYVTESVEFREEQINPYEFGLEYVMTEVEFYLLTKAQWKRLSVV